MSDERRRLADRRHGSARPDMGEECSERIRKVMVCVGTQPATAADKVMYIKYQRDNLNESAAGVDKSFPGRSDTTAIRSGAQIHIHDRVMMDALFGNPQRISVCLSIAAFQG